MFVSDVMTAKPITVGPDSSIADAAQLMLEHRISGLPVTNRTGVLVGIVTEGDLLRRAEIGTEKHRRRWLELLVGPGRLAADYIDAHARQVSEIMSPDVLSVSPDTPLADAVTLMEKHGIKRLPVVAGGQLTAIVSRADLVRALLRQLTADAAFAANHPVTDAEIRDRLVAIIDKEQWGPRYSVNVTVTDSVVQLHGTVTDDRERSALIVAAETVTGVKSVEDHLVWVEPNSGLVIPAPQ